MDEWYLISLLIFLLGFVFGIRVIMLKRRANLPQATIETIREDWDLARFMMWFAIGLALVFIVLEILTTK